MTICTESRRISPGRQSGVTMKGRTFFTDAVSLARSPSLSLPSRRAATTAAALPGMREKGWGRIINIASAHGLTASPFKSAYVAAKHGLVGLTKTIALESAEENITCNAICFITHWPSSLRLLLYAPAAMGSTSSTGDCLVGSSGIVVKHASKHSIS